MSPGANVRAPRFRSKDTRKFIDDEMQLVSACGIRYAAGFCVWLAQYKSYLTVSLSQSLPLCLSMCLFAAVAGAQANHKRVAYMVRTCIGFR